MTYLSLVDLSIIMAMMLFIQFLILLNCVIFNKIVEGKDYYDKSLGTGFDISKINLESSALSRGSKIFKSIPISYVEYQNLRISQQKFDYYENATSLVDSYCYSAGLTPAFLSAFSLKASLSGTYSTEVGETTSVMGAALRIITHSRKDVLHIECEAEELDSEFLIKFKLLEKYVHNPHKPESWYNYKTFLRNYGSHYVSEVIYGASLSQHLSAHSDNHYSHRQFKVKACLDLIGPVYVGILSAGLCGGILNNDKKSSHSLLMNSKLVVMGGSDQTRHEVLQSRSNENINKFLNDGSKHKAPVQYKFRSIADMLMHRFSKTQYAYQAANFKNYLEGFLNFGCSYENNMDIFRTIELQKFEFDTSNSGKFPHYNCTLAPQGCGRDSDCHFSPRGCECRGKSCVKYDKLLMLNGEIKPLASINYEKNFELSCSFSPIDIFGGDICTCDHPSYSRYRQVVWSSSQNMEEKKRKNRARIATKFSKY